MADTRDENGQPTTQIAHAETIGVELESIILHKDPAATEAPTRRQIARVNKAEIQGITAIADNADDGWQPTEPPGRWRVAGDVTVAALPDSEHWTREPTKEEIEIEARKWFGAELISYVLEDRGDSEDEQESGQLPWYAVIKLVMEAVSNNFDQFLNDSAAVHVHQGMKLSKEAKLLEGKKISVFVTANERQIDRLHKPYRSAPAPTPYAKSNRDNPVFADLLDMEVAERIAGASSLSELARMMCPKGDRLGLDGLTADSDRYYKVNLVGLEQRHTIEWRQCAGTKDPWEVCRWVRLLLAIKRKLVDMSLNDVIETYISHGTPELFKDIDFRRAWHDKTAFLRYQVECV